jgi:hypothetical protein
MNAAWCFRQLKRQLHQFSQRQHSFRLCCGLCGFALFQELNTQSNPIWWLFALASPHPVRRIELSAVTVRIPTASNSVQSDIGDEHGNHAPFMPISSRFKNLAARRTQVSGFGYNLDSRHFTCFWAS